jgi:hypothetical protein
MDMAQLDIPSNYQPYTVSFDPSAYDIPNNFDFDIMPSVGGTAEDLKAEATQLAQNIVNSLVRCYYLNDLRKSDNCPNPEDFLVAGGLVAAGEVVSNISKEEANRLAKLIAESRRVCISPDQIGGAGCASTVILGASGTAGSNQDKIATVSISYAKQDCTFTPTITMTTDIGSKNGRTYELTICDSEGVSKTINVLALEDPYESNIGVVINPTFTG